MPKNSERAAAAVEGASSDTASRATSIPRYAITTLIGPPSARFRCGGRVALSSVDARRPLPVQGHLTTVKVDDSWTVDDFDVAAAVP